MTNADMMIVFDVIITILGIYLCFVAFRMKKNQDIPGIFVAAEELPHCHDKKGFIAFLFPRAAGFGLICLGVGLEGVISDLIVPLGSALNAVMMIVFVGAWIWFSAQLRKGRERFF